MMRFLQQARAEQGTPVHAATHPQRGENATTDANCLYNKKSARPGQNHYRNLSPAGGNDVADPVPGDVTRLLTEIRAGNAQARDDLLVLVYGRLHEMAEAYMREEPDAF